MAAKGAKSKGRKGKGGKKGVRRGGKRRVTNVPERASLSEQRTLTVSGGFVNNRLYSLMNVSLDQFIRAPLVAQAYQHFRIKYIAVTIKPTWDTYGPGGAVPNGKPNLYFMIDKAGSIPANITLEGLKQMGARPRSFDEKPIKFGYRPSVLDVAAAAGGAAPVNQAAQYKISPWLSTSEAVAFQPWNASTIDHLGCYWYVECPVQGGAAQPYSVEMEVQFEFKKPLIATSVGQFSALPVSIAALNASRDGVVDARSGGDDDELVT